MLDSNSKYDNDQEILAKEFGDVYVQYANSADLGFIAIRSKVILRHEQYPGLVSEVLDHPTWLDVCRVANEWNKQIGETDYQFVEFVYYKKGTKRIDNTAVREVAFGS